MVVVVCFKYKMKRGLIMKMYHEVAVVKDGNKRVGWLLKKGTVGSNPPFMEYVDEAKFTQMVSQGWCSSL